MATLRDPFNLSLPSRHFLSSVLWHPWYLLPETYISMSIFLSVWLCSSDRPLRVDTTLSAIKVHQSYQPCHKVLWIKPAVIITLETVGVWTLNHGKISKPKCDILGLLQQLRTKQWIVVFRCVFLCSLHRRKPIVWMWVTFVNFFLLFVLHQSNGKEF